MFYVGDLVDRPLDAVSLQNDCGGWCLVISQEELFTLDPAGGFYDIINKNGHQMSIWLDYGWSRLPLPAHEVTS